MNKLLKPSAIIFMVAILFLLATIPIHLILAAQERGLIANPPPGTKILGSVMKGPPGMEEPEEIYRGAKAILREGDPRPKIIGGSYLWRLLRCGLFEGDTDTAWRLNFGNGTLAYLSDISNPPPLTIICLLLLVASIFAIFKK